MATAPAQWTQVKYTQTQLGATPNQAGQTTPGGLDLMTPALKMQPGALTDVLNFEVAQFGGYARIDGYERFDGRDAPSSAVYTIVQLSDFVHLPAVGDVVGQMANGAEGTVAAVVRTPVPYLVLTNVIGVFDAIHDVVKMDNVEIYVGGFELMMGGFVVTVDETYNPPAVVDDSDVTNTEIVAVGELILLGGSILTVSKATVVPSTGPTSFAVAGQDLYLGGEIAVVGSSAAAPLVLTGITVGGQELYAGGAQVVVDDTPATLPGTDLTAFTVGGRELVAGGEPVIVGGIAPPGVFGGYTLAGMRLFEGGEHVVLRPGVTAMVDFTLMGQRLVLGGEHVLLGPAGDIAVAPAASVVSSTQLLLAGQTVLLGGYEMVVSGDGVQYFTVAGQDALVSGSSLVV